VDNPNSREAQGAAAARDDQRFRSNTAARGVTQVHAERFACGPLDVTVSGDNERVRRKIADTLELYNVRWEGQLEPVHIDIHESDSTAALGKGSYLTC